MPFIGEHKTDIGISAASAGVGALLGNYAYNNTPSKMTRVVEEGSKKREYITNRFIDYAEKVSEKDLFSRIDSHTERIWVKHQMDVINKNASKAKMHPKGNERWQFQKIYDLGVKFMTNRKEVAPEDIGLAKRGANAIYYGRFVERRNLVVMGAVLCGALALGIKKGIEKFQENKRLKELENNKN